MNELGLPFFISFPRTGSNWYNAVLELYLDRPRLRRSSTSFMPTHRTDYLYFHDHDLDLKIPNQRILYLYREPCATIYSYCSGDPSLDVHATARLYNKHLTRWLVINKEETISVKYENILRYSTPGKTAADLFFGVSYPIERWDEAIKRCTKEKIANKGSDEWINNKLLTQEYAEKREEFKNKYYDDIYNIVINGKLDLFFPAESDKYNGTEIKQVNVN